MSGTEGQPGQRYDQFAPTAQWQPEAQSAQGNSPAYPWHQNAPQGDGGHLSGFSQSADTSRAGQAPQPDFSAPGQPHTPGQSAPQWQPQYTAAEATAWAGTPESAQADPTLLARSLGRPDAQWTAPATGQGHPTPSPGAPHGQPAAATGQTDPTLLAQTVAGPFGQPGPVPGQADPTMLAQSLAPFGQPAQAGWQPGSAAPALGMPHGQPTPAAGQADPTLLAQSLGSPYGQQASSAAARTPGSDSADRDRTVLAQSLNGWAPADSQPSQETVALPDGRRPLSGSAPTTVLGQPPSSVRAPSAGPDNAAPTMYGYPNPDRFGQPNPGVQWVPASGAPGQYGGMTPPGSGYGAPQYGPHNGFGPQPTTTKSRKGKAFLLVGLVVLLVAAGAVTAVALTDRGSDPSAQQVSPSMVSALTTTASAHSATATTAKPTATTSKNAGGKQPVIPGYQVVVAPDRGAAYDVPPGWTIASPGTIGGFGEPPNAVVGKGYATEGKGYCPGSTRTVSFLTGSDTRDSASAATELGTKTATLAYKASRGGSPGAAVPIVSLDDSQHGMFVETTGTVSEAKPGCATAYSVYTAAYPTDSGNFVMVIVADTGVANALDAETAKRIFTSIRASDG